MSQKDNQVANALMEQIFSSNKEADQNEEAIVNIFLFKANAWARIEMRTIFPFSFTVLPLFLQKL